MKKALLFVTTLFFVTLSYAQKETLKVFSNWHKLDSHKYKVIKINSQKVKQDSIKEDSSSYTFTFKIIDSTANTYRIEWVCDESPVKDMSDEMQELINNKFGNLRIIYTTDHRGVFKEIENWKEIGDLFRGILSLQFKEKNLDTSKINPVMKDLLNVYSSKFGIENVVLREIRLFHFPYGYEHSINDTLTFEQNFPNPLMAGTVKGTTKYFFSNLNKTKHQAVFNQQSIINGEDSQKMIRTIVDRYISSMEVKTEKDKEELATLKNNIPLMKFSNTTTLFFKYNYQKCFPLNIEFNQLIDLDMKIYNVHKTSKIKIIQVY